MATKTASTIIAKVIATETDPKFDYTKLTINLDESKKHYDHAVLLKGADKNSITAFAKAQPGQYIELQGLFVDTFEWKGKPLATLRFASAKLLGK